MKISTRKSVLIILSFAAALLANVKAVKADFNTDAEVVFGWAELTYPDIAAPSQATKSVDQWLYRDYAKSDIYVGLNKQDNGVYYIGGNALKNGAKPIYFDSVANVLKLANKDEKPKPDNFQSLLGKWELRSYQMEIIRQNGEVFTSGVTDLKVATGVYPVWEFFSNGNFYVQEAGQRWSLVVTQLEGANIIAGKLTLTQGSAPIPSFKDPDTVYDVQTSHNPVTNITGMGLSKDITNTGPYKKNTYVMDFNKL